VRIKEKSVALSIQAKKKLLEFIKEHHMTQHQKLPSESRLVEMLGVSRHTVREALALLEQDHLIYKAQGRGTFIRRSPVEVEEGLENLSSITSNIKNSGYEPGTLLVTIREEVPSKEMVKVLGLKERDRVVTFVRLRTADGMPAAYCVDSVPRHLFPGKVPQKIEGESLLEFLEKTLQVKPEYAEAYISPTITEEEMVIAGMPKNQMLLQFHQVHYDSSGTPYIFSNDYLNPEIFRFKVNRTRQG